MPDLDALIADLDSTDRLIRSNAVWKVMELGEEARVAIPALKRLLDDHEEPYIRLLAAGAISKFAPEVPDVVRVLIGGLTDPIGIHRATACEFLGERQDKSGVLKAMTLLSDPDFSVRFAAGVAVGKTFHHWFHAVAVCVAMLRDSDQQNRNVGKESLLSLGNRAKADIDLLKMALADAPWEARLDIEEVLDELRNL